MQERLLNSKLLILSCVFILLGVTIFGCDPIVKTLAPLSSPTVEDSKNRGVFKSEYYPVDTVIIDTLNINIQEAFVEKQYRYEGFDDLTYRISEDKYQLKIIFNEKLSKHKYFEDWVLEGFHASSPYSLIKELDTVPPYLVKIKILKVDINELGLAGENDKQLLGLILLNRKQS